MRYHDYVLRSCLLQLRFLNKRTAKTIGRPYNNRLFKICCRRGGHWPSACENSQRCEKERGCKTDYCHCHRSGWRKNDTRRFQCESPLRQQRTSDARPYNEWVFLNNAAVGAAIGRPPVKIRSDVKQSAGAKNIIAIVTGRAGAKTICANLKLNRPCAEHDLMLILQ